MCFYLQGRFDMEPFCSHACVDIKTGSEYVWVPRVHGDMQGGWMGCTPWYNVNWQTQYVKTFQALSGRRWVFDNFS